MTEEERKKERRKKRRKERLVSRRRCNLLECPSFFWRGVDARGTRTVRTQIYVSRDTSQNPPQPPRIELTRRLPPSIFLNSARGTLVIPNSLMALDQLSRRPFAQIPVTLLLLFSILSCTCSKIKLSLRIIIEYVCQEYKSTDVLYHYTQFHLDKSMTPMIDFVYNNL